MKGIYISRCRISGVSSFRQQSTPNNHKMKYLATSYSEAVESPEAVPLSPSTSDKKSNTKIYTPMRSKKHKCVRKHAHRERAKEMEMKLIPCIYVIYLKDLLEHSPVPKANFSEILYMHP